MSLFGQSDKQIEEMERTQVNSVDVPDNFQALMDEIISQSFGAAGQPFQGQRIAGLTPDELAAYEQIRGLPGADALTDVSGRSTDAILQGLGGLSRPPTSADIQPFMDPYKDLVLGDAQERLNESLSTALTDLTRRTALGSGSSGRAGIRGDIGRGVAIEDYLQSSRELQHRGLSDAFNQALGLYEGRQRDLLQAGFSGRQSDVGFARGINELGLGRAAAREGIGATQRGLEQALLDFQYGEPFQRAQFLSGIASQFPTNLFTRREHEKQKTESYTQQNPLNTALGLASTVGNIAFPGMGGGLGGLAKGIGGLFGGSGGGGALNITGGGVGKGFSGGGLVKRYQQGGEVDPVEEARRKALGNTLKGIIGIPGMVADEARSLAEPIVGPAAEWASKKIGLGLERGFGIDTGLVSDIEAFPGLHDLDYAPPVNWKKAKRGLRDIAEADPEEEAHKVIKAGDSLKRQPPKEETQQVPSAPSTSPKSPEGQHILDRLLGELEAESSKRGTPEAKNALFSRALGASLQSGRSPAQNLAGASTVYLPEQPMSKQELLGAATEATKAKAYAQQAQAAVQAAQGKGSSKMQELLLEMNMEQRKQFFDIASKLAQSRIEALGGLGDEDTANMVGQWAVGQTMDMYGMKQPQGETPKRNVVRHMTVK